ncbi:M42 family metallopeptidase [Candidatus Phytoplasma phoenicium]|uniref:Endo-1,4-beta-glucanase n=1 Tax=Candidatus Phytoplasma phoenicium TaxID=198422 RepID=A0A0L0MKW2_9MOLU|nr:M42 family metallopeptidase [Candidatus Phytoplasma phoenicium]KND62624.1 endo-1,4-beta-glucanase [Candidatus Phytoplasma phoenicium]
MSNWLENLKNLTMLSGVPGQEKKVNHYIKNQIKDLVDKIEYDNLGSMNAYKGTQGPKVMLAGHVDEIGLMVTEITKEGFVKFQTLGGWLTSVMLAQLWQIHTNKGILYAVTGAKPPHSLSPADRMKTPDVKSLFLDLGVENKEEAENLGVRIGDMVTPYTEFKTLGNPNFLLAKAFDNRVGALVVMEVLAALKNNPNQFIGSFTVQEEVGLRGARTSVNKVQPLIAIAVDVGISDDTPGDANFTTKVLGKGPQISCYDSGLIAHKDLREFVLQIANKHKIPYQEPKPTGGQTDASIMHLQNNGAASIAISIPTRYIHSHTSVIHKEDVTNAIKLLTLLIQQLDKQKVQEILFN